MHRHTVTATAARTGCGPSRRVAERTADRQGAGDPKTAISVRSVNAQPEKAPFGQFVEKSGVWLPRIVNLTNRTLVSPPERSTSLSWPRSSAVNVPDATWVNVLPS